jgi:hypothetical protein
MSDNPTNSDLQTAVARYVTSGEDERQSSENQYSESLALPLPMSVL